VLEVTVEPVTGVLGPFVPKSSIPAKNNSKKIATPVKAATTSFHLLSLLTDLVTLQPRGIDTPKNTAIRISTNPTGPLAEKSLYPTEASRLKNPSDGVGSVFVAWLLLTPEGGATVVVGLSVGDSLRLPGVALALLLVGVPDAAAGEVAGLPDGERSGVGVEVLSFAFDLGVGISADVCANAVVLSASIGIWEYFLTKAIRPAARGAGGTLVATGVPDVVGVDAGDGEAVAELLLDGDPPGGDFAGVGDAVAFALAYSIAAAATESRSSLSVDSFRTTKTVSAFSAIATTSPMIKMMNCARRLYQPDTRSIPLSNHASIFMRAWFKSFPAESIKVNRARPSFESGGITFFSTIASRKVLIGFVA
jgi:hypothetical protein